MSKLGTVVQQPTERLSYTIDYGEYLTDGDNVSSAVAVVTPAGRTVDKVSVFGPRVKFWATGGTAGVKYKVELTVNTHDGRIIQDEIIFKIKEI